MFFLVSLSWRMCTLSINRLFLAPKTIKNDDGFYKQTNVVLLRILFKEENRARSLQTTKKKFTCLNKLK